MKRSRFLLVVLATVTASVAAYSQTPGDKKSNEPRTVNESKKNDQATPEMPPGTPVEIKVLVSEFDGAKKVSTLPYSVRTIAWANATQYSHPTDSMRFDVNVKLPDGSHSGVNMDIDYGAYDRGGDEFQIPITVSRASVEPITSSSTSDRPLTPFFRASSTVVLRNGQTAEAVAAVDPVTGHVLKVDVTLTVLK
jgi:hypothetical protein